MTVIAATASRVAEITKESDRGTGLRPWNNLARKSLNLPSSAISGSAPLVTCNLNCSSMSCSKLSKIQSPHCLWTTHPAIEQFLCTSLISRESARRLAVAHCHGPRPRGRHYHRWSRRSDLSSVHNSQKSHLHALGLLSKVVTSSYCEGNDGHVNLPEDWPESFEVIYGRVYSG